MNLAQLLETKKYVLFDGALGTMLQKHGLQPGENPTLMNVRAPEAVEAIHRMYVEAGSDIICANTFYANAFTLKKTGCTVGEIVDAAVKIAKRAAGEESPAAQTRPLVAQTRPLVALDIGPLGQILEPAGDLSFEEAAGAFRELAIAGEKAGADLAAIETISDPEELRAAVTAIFDNTKLPVFATMTFEASGFTFMGCTPEKLAETAEELGVAAVGLNCSLEPAQMLGIASRLAKATRLPLIIKPNAGLPDAISGKYRTGAEEFAAQMAQFKPLGARVVGGCCGTTPEYIRELKREFEN